MKKLLLVICCAMFLPACSAWRDAPAGIAGVSTKALEDGRVDSIYQTYPCDIGACFDAVSAVAGKSGYYIFSSDRTRGLVVLMKIPGCVDTTEVGVFLSHAPHGEGVLVELSSRSSLAKKTVAKTLLSDLADRFIKK